MSDDWIHNCKPFPLGRIILYQRPGTVNSEPEREANGGEFPEPGPEVDPDDTYD